MSRSPWAMRDPGVSRAARGRRYRPVIAMLGALLALIVPSVGVALDPPPGLTSGAYILVEPRTGAVLASRTPDRALPMASTTKIMTALVTLERARLDDSVVVPSEAIIGGSTARLVAGEVLTVRDLLVGLLVPSGNDAALALAIHVAGSEEAFVALMNSRARALGLRRTRFVTPHGLDEPGHQASVRDLVRLARVAMRNPEFRRIVALPSAEIDGAGGGVRRLESQNDLLARNPEVDGVKTGHTDGAGYALVAHARRERLGVELYAALIGAPSERARASDAAKLLDWGFAQYARPMILRDGQIVAHARVRDRGELTLPLAVSGSVVTPIRLDERITQTIVARPQVIGPVPAGRSLGRIDIRAGDRLIARRRLVAASDVSAPGLLQRLRAALERVVG